MKKILSVTIVGLMMACANPSTNDASTSGTSADTLRQEATPAPAAASALEGTRWLLEEVANTAVTPMSEDTRAWITFQIADSTVNGNAGCNGFFGPYHRSGTNGLRLGELGSTMKACEDMTTESALFAALPKVNGYTITDGTLSLLQDSTVVTRWKAAK